MTVKEAYELVTKDAPELTVVSCTEYDSLFAFQVEPKNRKSNKGVLIGFSRSVNKTTGEVRDFKPFHISLKEYENGKIIKNFK